MTLTLDQRAELADYTHSENGWLYGVWYCGTAWQKAVLYGQFPAKFWRRFRSLFPDIPDNRLLHLCSGTTQTPEIRVDVSREFNPTVQADVERLPFPPGAFDLIFIDPPYSKEDAQKYGVPMLRRNWVVAEALRLLPPGGCLAWLDVRYPSYRRKDFKIFGLIGIVTGFLRATRVLSIFEKV